MPRSIANNNTDASTLKKKIALPHPIIMSDDDEDISYQSERKRKFENIPMNNTQGESSKASMNSNNIRIFSDKGGGNSKINGGTPTLCASDEYISNQSERKRKSENVQMNNTRGESSKASMNSNNKILILSDDVIPDRAVEKRGGNSKINEDTPTLCAFVAANKKLTTGNGKPINMENHSKLDQGIQVVVTIENITVKIQESNQTSPASYSIPDSRTIRHFKDNSPKILDSRVFTSPSTSKTGSAVVINSSDSSAKYEDKKEKQSFKEMEVLKETFQLTFKDTAKKNLLTSSEIRLIEKFFNMTRKNQYFLMKLFMQHMWHNIMDFCTEIGLDRLKISFEYVNHKYDEFVDKDISSLSTYEMLSILDNEKLCRLQTDLKPDVRHRKKSNIIPSLVEKYEEDELKQAAKKYLGICIKMKDDVWSTFYKAFILQCYCNPSYSMDIQTYLKDMTDKVRYPEMGCQNFLPFEKRGKFSRFFDAVLMKIKLNRELKNMKEKEKTIRIVKKICDEAFQKLKTCDADGKWKKGDIICLRQFTAEYIYIDILQTNIETLLTKYHATIIDWLEYLIKNYPNNRHVVLWYKELAEIKIDYLRKYTHAGEDILRVYKIHEKFNVFDSLQLIELHQMCEKIINTRTYKLWASLRDQLFYYMAKCRDELSSGESRKVTEKYIDVDANESLTGKRKRRTDNHDMESEALEHYRKEGYEGLYCQEKFFAALFVLFFWDVIYEFHVPNAVISKLQTAPLDIYSNDFYQYRKKDVELRLNDIATRWTKEHLEKTLKQNYNNHSHEKSFVDFEISKINRDDIENIVRYIDRKVLSKILSVFARNSGKCRIGLPKLFLWNAESQYKFVAVENPKKKLDHNEYLWLKFLSCVGAIVEICRKSDDNTEVKSRKKFKNDNDEDK